MVAPTLWRAKLIRPSARPVGSLKGIPARFRKHASPMSISPTGSGSISTPGSAIFREMANIALPAVASAVNPALGTAMSLMLSQLGATSSTQSQTTSSGRKRFGAGRWTGYVKGRRIKRKRKRRVKATNNASYQFSVENSWTATPSVSGLVGHSTFSQATGFQMIFGSLLRKLFIANGIWCSVPTSNVTPMALNTVITFEFMYAGTPDGFSYTVNPVPATFNSILDGVIAAFQTKYDALAATLASGNIRFRRMSMNAPADVLSAGARAIDLQNASITIWANSRLKMQNRSINSAGNDQADDVDNVPLNCVMYETNGTGTDSKYDFFNIRINANGYHSFNKADPDLFQDAPIASHFRGVKKTGFYRLQPGGIKTSVIKSGRTYSLDYLTETVCRGRADANVRLPIGKFRFIQYEKTIEANQASPVAMSLAFENQVFVAATISLGNKDQVVPRFVRTN